MKYLKIILLFIFLMTSFVSVFSQNDQINTWLFNIPTPHTLNQGIIGFDLTWRFTKYNKPDPRTEMTEIVIIGNYGFSNRLNVSFITPYGWTSSDVYGIADISLGLKYKLMSSSNFNISLAPNIFFPTGEKDDFLGGGKVNYQINVNMGLQKNRYEIVLNTGYGYQSHMYPPNREFTNQGVLMFSGAFMLKIIPTATFILEGVGRTVSKFSDEDFYFQGGGIFNIKDTLSLKGGLGMGLPRDSRANTDYLVTLGVSYLFKR